MRRSWSSIAAPAAAILGMACGGTAAWVARRSVAPLGLRLLDPRAASLWMGAAAGLLAWWAAIRLIRWLGEAPGPDARRAAGRAVAPLGLLCLVLGEDGLALGHLRDLAWIAGLGGALWSLGREAVRVSRRSGTRAAAWAGRLRSLSPGGIARLVGLVAFALALLQAMDGFGERRTLVGDEPSYVTIAHSMATDGDISMADDYLDREYERWVTGDYPIFAHQGKDGRMYPHHGIGLPLLLAPFHRVGLLLPGRGLVRVLRIAMGIPFALLLAQAYLLAWELTGDRRASLLLAGVLGATAPLLFYATEVYPETTAALLLVWGVRWSHSAASRPIGRGLRVGLAAALLPWLGAKYIPAAAALAAVHLLRSLRSPGKWRGAGGLVLPGAVLGGLYLGFLHALYGVITPRAIYHGVAHPLPEGGLIQDLARLALHPLDTLGTIGVFLQGALLEQRVGLLIWAPIYLFLLPEILRALRHRRAVLAAMVPGLVHLLFYAYSDNWGGYCPPNRPLVAALPLLALPLAWAFLGPVGRLKRSALVLVGGMSLFWSWTFLTHDRWLYHTMNPHLVGGAAEALAKLSMPFGPWWPDFFPLVMGPERPEAVNLIWTLAIAALVAGDLALRRLRPPPGSASSARIAPLVVLALLALLVAWRVWALPGDRFRLDQPGPPEHGLYVWDTGLYGPELGGAWIAGDRRAEAWLETREETPAWRATTHALLENRIEIVLGRDHRWLEVSSGEQLQVELRPGRPHRRGPYRYYKLRALAACGVIPREVDDGSKDDRNLGAFLRLERARWSAHPAPGRAR